ncbi:DUF1906 domain-containing protein [Corynebacterium felinum]|uniref:Rv2525c-like glycoside hydrolase-like domain-containing protein n=1 Tax=Corynebacterium felinum TaxID=131318 RepID=A0ABU2B8S9_9CORY|nr:DUF1906 domain-containing protein [Corynebacterium felinum]MDF5820272.1 DUF1906 domain-containing protein [Corynebacterium felinum]MDR7355023.1 hypothetical protein [Corynebacterium felinum]WJY94377.1 hypothetical protein CFELI_03715 [Corynebacterium felinum]
MSFLNRKTALTVAALTITASLGFTTISPTTPHAEALGPVLGTVLDYSAGVPSGAAVRQAGHIGTVRYVSHRRPGAEWMKGKPVGIAETRDHAANGLKTASVYQFGKDATADWKRGAAGAAIHAPQAIALHRAAGGPTGRPIYVAIDDNPTHQQYVTQIRPYLQGFNTALRAGGYSMGIYGNYNVIEWATQDGLGSYFWQHDWGSNGRIHPRTTIHQVAGWQTTVGGIQSDVNNVYQADWGQWTPGQAGTPLPPAAPAVPTNPAPPAANGHDVLNRLDGETLNKLGTALSGMSSQIPGGHSLPVPSAAQIDMALNIAKHSS